MKRTLFAAPLLALVAMLAVAAGEGEGAAASLELSAPGEYPIVQEKQTVSVIGTYDQRLASGTLEDAKFTLWFEELTNIHVDWVDMIEWEEAVEKYNLILASGDLPDVLIPHSRITVQQAFDQGAAGAFVGLKDLIAEHMPGLSARLAEVPEVHQRITMPDGENYYFPIVSAGCFHCQYSTKMWVYKPWVDQLGLKWPPETPEEFADMLRAFRDQDPNGNGKQDEIPFLSATSGWNVDPISFLMNAWIYTAHPYDLNYGALLERSPSDVRFVANTQEWRDGLKYLRMLHDEELLAEESFVWTEKEAKQTTENPDHPVVGSFQAGWFGRFTIHGGGTGRFAEFKPIPPLRGPSGLQQTRYHPPSVNVQSVITSAAEHPAMIAKWVDWFYEDPIAHSLLARNFLQEGSEWRYLTEEEKTLGWVTRDGGPAKTIRLESDVYSLDLDDDGWSRTTLGYWEWDAHSAMPPEWEGDPTRVEWRLMVATRDLMLPYRVEKHIPPDVIFQGMEQEELVDLTETITSRNGLVMQRGAEFITGKRDIHDDATWDAYVDELERAGVERYVELWQEALQNSGYFN